MFINDGGQVVLEFDKDGTGDVAATDLSHRYLWGEAVDQLLADEQVDWPGNSTYEGEVLWAMTDSLGSARDVIDSDGNLRIHRQYDSFGNVVGETHFNAAGSTVTSGTGFIDEAFGYTGRWLDKATKLQNNLNRWYDSYEGRFLSEDPAEQGTNPYEYARNSPGNAVDPEGLAWWNLWTADAAAWAGERAYDIFVPDPQGRELDRRLDALAAAPCSGRNGPSSRIGRRPSRLASAGT